MRYVLFGVLCAAGLLVGTAASVRADHGCCCCGCYGHRHYRVYSGYYYRPSLYYYRPYRYYRPYGYYGWTVTPRRYGYYYGRYGGVHIGGRPFSFWIGF